MPSVKVTIVSPPPSEGRVAEVEAEGPSLCEAPRPAPEHRDWHAGLRLLQLASQTLPTGAFAYSSGLETVHHFGHLEDGDECVAFLSGLMETVVLRLELPLFLRLRAAALEGDFDRVEALSAYLLANRETMELRDQERQMARALHRVLEALHPRACETWHPQTFSEALAVASCLFQLGDADAQLLLVYTWLEQQLSALSRLIPLGPIASQKVLDRVLGHAPAVIEQSAQITDDEIGASAPSLAIFSSLHETQYTRIFRS